MAQQDMAGERHIPGRLVDARPIIPGTPRERDEILRQASSQRRPLSRLVHSRLGRAVGLAAGAATLGAIFALGSGGNNNNQYQAENTPRPKVSETFDLKQSALKIIDAKDDNPDILKKVVANIGSSISVSFKEGSNSNTLPRLRDTTEKTDADIVSLSDIKAINGSPVEIRPGTQLKISNFIKVPGYDADGGLGGPEGEWLALEATMQDDSRKLVYMSISNQTRHYWDIEPSDSSHQVPLSEAINLPGEELNKVEVVN